MLEKLREGYGAAIPTRKQRHVYIVYMHFVQQKFTEQTLRSESYLHTYVNGNNNKQYSSTTTTTTMNSSNAPGGKLHPTTNPPCSKVMVGACNLCTTLVWSGCIRTLPHVSCKIRLGEEIIKEKFTVDTWFSDDVLMIGRWYSNDLHES